MVPGTEFLFHSAFALGGLWLSVIDAREHRLPNIGTGLLGIAMVALGLGCVILGFADSTRLHNAVFASVLGTGFYAALAWLPPYSMGWGDVKLQASLGFYLGWLNPWLVLGHVIAAFMLGGLAAGGLMMCRKMNTQDHLAFGPFMVGAGAGVVFLGKSLEII